jgi:hypothetical protein
MNASLTRVVTYVLVLCVVLQLWALRLAQKLFVLLWVPQNSVVVHRILVGLQLDVILYYVDVAHPQQPTDLLHIARPDLLINMQTSHSLR